MVKGKITSPSYKLLQNLQLALPKTLQLLDSEQSEAKEKLTE